MVPNDAQVRGVALVADGKSTFDPVSLQSKRQMLELIDRAKRGDIKILLEPIAVANEKS